ncbi:N-acetylglucosamine kinase-like BadF-type ATPase [Agromyces cerinus]|uniref:BadF/BadG/BcrA/BcrD ATPase family protein n=1 Tax=Agromyces cerinus TaxID=33878 RepID=UPI00195851B3|nr:BadF/BadG/BcrA/BcrD ATPase family protein [Agromyces cerinus]MBM7832861.1 N-acetylglucosamine kinase-like BadF-type ATPase [Agromyces cerinus]
MSLLLGIDIGGSGSRVAIRAGAGPRRELAGERIGVTAAGSSVPQTAIALLRRARDLWPEEFAGVDGVALGATGLATLVARPEALLQAMGTELAVGRAPSDRRPPTAVAIDAVTAHLGALGGGSGAIVALGTGAVALGTDGHEIWRRVDGWGHLLGDRGSGAWIGNRGLRAAIRAHDGVDASGSALLAAARARFGDPLGWPAQLYTRDDRAGVLAGFAPDVFALASDGDAAATTIVAAAGAEAARSGLAALAPGLEPRLALTGGVVSAGGLLVSTFAETVAVLRPDVETVAPLGDPLDGALRLAGRAAVGGVASRAPYVWADGGTLR